MIQLKILILLKIIYLYHGHFSIISQHKNVRVDILRQYSKIPWDYYSLTRDIDFELVIENLDLPWNFKYLSRHPDLNNEILKRNIDLDWDFKYLSCNTPFQFSFWTLLKMSKMIIFFFLLNT